MSDPIKIYPTADECRIRAFELLDRLQGSKDDPASVAGDALKFVQTRMIAEAQVWATLATVPEPLTAENSVELVSTPEVCRYQTRERL